MNEGLFSTQEQQILLRMFKKKIVQVCDQMHVPNSFKFQALYLFNEIYAKMKLGTYAPVLVSATIIYITSKVTEMHIDLDQLCKDLDQPLETLLNLELHILGLLNFQISYYWVDEKKETFVKHVSRLTANQTPMLRKYLEIFKQHFVYYQTNILIYSLEQTLSEEQTVLFIFKYTNRMDRSLFIEFIKKIFPTDNDLSIEKLVVLLEQIENNYIENKKLDECNLEESDRNILKEKLQIWNK